ncbi:hypothetical protein [Candidatus Poriferisodalis sp.]|uniref:hypothetical protein n=1 Tax=Candidatus Poriferisodalis sp. TaxID=3101277 RepID=UPI003B012C1C
MADVRNSCGISFDRDSLPSVLIADNGASMTSISSLDALFREYLLYSFLGFISTDFEMYVDFYRGRAADRAGFYDARTRTVYLNPHVDGFWTDQILAHELAHVWLNDALRERQSNLPLSIADEPDHYLTIAAVSEGFAHACQSQYAAERILAQRDLPAKGSGRSPRDTMPLDNGPLDRSLALAPFFERASGWTYSIGQAYVTDRLRSGDPTSIVALARRDDWPQNTAELMGYDVDSAGRQLGALLMREALVWSGVAWQNADAISASIVHDEFSIEAGGSSDEWCVTLSVEFGETKSARPRSLNAADALRRWAILAGNEIIDEDSHHLTFRRCSSDSIASASSPVARASQRRLESISGEDDRHLARSDDTMTMTPPRNYSPLPYASSIRWSPRDARSASRSDGGRLIAPMGLPGVDIDFLLEEALDCPEYRQRLGGLLESLLEHPDRLVEVGVRETPAENWRGQLRDAAAILGFIESERAMKFFQGEEGSSEPT